MADKTTVALLGTGIMGVGMGHNLLKAGLPLRVWNRTPEKAAPLVEQGAELAAGPAEAVSSADVIVTMLRDGDTVADTIAAAAPGLRQGQVWAQMTTVGVQAAGELAALAAEHGLTFVDAPVLGSRAPAEQGQLLIFAAGPASAKEPLAPVFGAIGSRTTWLSDDPASAAASRLKIVVNSWVLDITAGAAEVLTLAKVLDVDPNDFFAAIDGGAMDVPYFRMKAANILNADWEPNFTVNNAAKDADLIVAAAQAYGARLDVAGAIAARLHRADQQGHGDKDMAANYFASFGPGDEADSSPRSADPAT